MTERATAPRDATADQDPAEDERLDANEPGGTIAREKNTAAAREAERAREQRAEPGRDAERPRDAERSRQPHAETPSGQAAEREAELFDRATAADLERRWQAAQVRFVDEPREAVEAADKLVAEVLDQLTSSFASERRELERAWSGGREASTEELRQAIRRYRSFFNRLLAA